MCKLGANANRALVHARKGACTYDVCTERGEGGTPKADAVRKLSKGGCVKMQTRGEGVKKSENFADIICTWPLSQNIQVICA